MTKDLQRRLDRLDGGPPADVSLMSDGQLLRIISRGVPDPGAFLAKPEREQDQDIERLSGRSLTSRELPLSVTDESVE